MLPPLHYYFIYRVQDGTLLDIRTPCGGVTVRGWGETACYVRACNLADRRFPCHSWELLNVKEVHCWEDQKNVKILEDAERKAFAEFRELMTA